MPTAEKLAKFCESNFDLEEAELSETYYYQSLPFCVIDAVYSINAHYTSTENVVKRFCEKYDLKRIRDSKKHVPPKSEQLSISEFLNITSNFSYEKLADEIFENNQRTSSRNGILKANAVTKFAEVLKDFKAEYLQERDKFIGNKDFKTKIKQIRGQGSEISTRYFFMLAGSDDYIKPDRMIGRFIKEQTGKELSVQESHELIVKAQKILSDRYKHLTPRLLDYLIWNYQSKRDTS